MNRRTFFRSLAAFVAVVSFGKLSIAQVPQTRTVLIADADGVQYRVETALQPEVYLANAAEYGCKISDSLRIPAGRVAGIQFA